jgi:hypothetical protein
MARIEKTIFISYRRTNYRTALAIFQNLHVNEYAVFIDYKSIPSGDDLLERDGHHIPWIGVLCRINSFQNQQFDCLFSI